jgi:hypothetical protein
MKTNILLIFILILMVSTIQGQDQDSLSNRKFCSVSVHFGQNQIKEMSLFPMVHKGKVTEFSFETERVKSNMKQFQLFFTYSRIKTSLEELAKSGNIRLGMDYSYNFLIFQNSNLRYYAGPQASLCYSFMLYPNWDESHTYWADYLSFGANNVLSVSLRNESEWFTSLNFSLLGFFSRQNDIRPYKMDDYTPGGVLKAFNSNIEPGIMNKVLLINFKTEYRFPVFVDKLEAITFNMGIIRMSRNEGDPVIQIINRFGIKIML